MSLISNGAGESADANFYNGVITSSLRFNEISESRLNSPSFASDGGDTWSWSAWVKLCDLGTRQCLFGRASNNAGFYFNDSANTNKFAFNDDGAVVRTAPALRRDPSAWYHVTINGNGTINKLWVNGVEQTFNANPNLGKINEAVVHFIGFGIDDSSAYYYDGQMADVNFVDGTALDYTAFAEFKNGILIPIEPSVTYGDNGFRLQFKGTGTSANSSGIGADTSGNDSHFSVVNLNAHDVLTDSPENNWCTFSPLHFRASGGMPTLTEGNLKFGADGLASSFGVAFTTFNLTSGKWYAELRTTGNTSASVGVINVGHYGYDKFLVQNPQNETGNWTLFMDGTDTKSRLNGSLADPNYTAFNNTQVLGIALNADDKELSFFVDGTLQTGLGSSGVIDISTGGSVRDAWSFQAGTFNGSAVVFHWNFGQDSSFGGTETATSNSDGEGFGTFHNAPPSGFLAVCSANLPELAIGPNSGDDESSDDYFETVLYTGNSTDDRTVAVNFAPDWVWLKSRFTSGGSVHSHFQFDTTRGETNFLKSDTTAAAADDAATLKAFTSTGFTLGNSDVINDTGTSYAAWNWKANGGTTTTNDASSTSIGSIDSVIQANTTAGFSIVTYTGTGSAGTVAHGLGAVPQMYIIKRRSNTGNWYVFHKDIGNTHRLRLDETSARVDEAVAFNDTSPTSSVFSIGTSVDVNADANTYVAYVFAEVEGYSKIGFYTGNANADGPFVFTGFRPAWIIVKNTTAAGNSWHIMDNKRNTVNVVDNMQFQSSAAEDTGSNTNFDLLSNGFKLRGTSQNDNDHNFIFMAFAEAPFKYANSR